jgi:hypothetical protein
MTPLSHLLLTEWLNHAVLGGLFPDPTVTLNRHVSPGPEILSLPDKKCLVLHQAMSFIVRNAPGIDNGGMLLQFVRAIFA